MPITQFLKDSNLTPDLTRVAKIAFEMTRTALKLPDNDHPVVTLAAKRIVELAKGGECNPDHLCEQVLREVRGWRFQEQELFDVRRGSGFSLLGSPTTKRD
jgi:hypothetical protein